MQDAAMSLGIQFPQLLSTPLARLQGAVQLSTATSLPSVLGSPSSKRIASHRISICLEHPHELLKSFVRVDFSGTWFYGYPSDESS